MRYIDYCDGNYCLVTSANDSIIFRGVFYSPLKNVEEACYMLKRGEPVSFTVSKLKI